MDINIRHEGASEYYDYLLRNYNNNVPMEEKLLIAEKLKVIQDIVGIYEQGKRINFIGLSTILGKEVTISLCYN